VVKDFTNRFNVFGRFSGCQDEVNLLSIKRLTKHYGRVKVLEELSLEVNDSGPLVILGPSGCGKTTLLRLIAGLEMPDAGEIHLQGSLASKPGWLLRPHKRGIGFVFQTSALWPHMTAAENIVFGLKSGDKQQKQERLNELLEQIELQGFAKRYPDELSGGEARRVALARCLAPQPKFLLMDEPLTNLDADLKKRMLDLIKRAAAQTGALLIYVTHEQAEAEQMEGRVLALRNGRIQG
jgi:iron(III) transport system ATP-binding protein